MTKLERREFLKMAGIGSAGVLLSGIMPDKASAQMQIFSKEQALKPFGEKVIDVHMHFEIKRIKRVLEVMDNNFIHYGISIGLEDDKLYPILEAIKPYRNRLGLIYAFDWKLAQTDPEFFKKAPDMLEKAINAGAVGIKNFKAFGLEARDSSGKLISINDPRMFPVWERAQKLNVPVAFHIGDPKAFFEPISSKNERWDELHLHPEWSFADEKKYPKLPTLFQQANQIVKAFPKINFHYVHFGYSEDMKLVASWLDELPNLHLDVAARLGELGRQSADESQRIFNKFQDRIMFGTDRMFYNDCEVQGAGPCKDFTKAEDELFYNIHWRYFQTNDKQFDHPTPVQGNWKIDGIGLEKDVLKKLYWDNAMKFYKLDRFGVV